LAALELTINTVDLLNSGIFSMVLPSRIIFSQNYWTFNSCVKINVINPGESSFMLVALLKHKKKLIVIYCK